MQYMFTKSLVNGVAALNRRGGPYARAAKDVEALLGRISRGDADPFKGLQTTNHGENRIKHCVKYDLTGRSRLVTVVNAGICFLLAAGTHDDIDEWLDSNRGKQFVAGDDGKMLEIVAPAETYEDGEQRHVIDRCFDADMQLLERIPATDIEPLMESLPYGLTRKFHEITVMASDDELLDVCFEISDEEKRNAMFDTLAALARNRVEDAQNVIKLYLGSLQAIDEVADPEELKSSADIQSIPTDDPQWIQLFEHFVKTANYKEWMLFLHPDQRKVVDEDFNGSAKLLGVSGSGKTCVVVKRAVRLAQLYPNQKVLVLTLNHPLANLISELVEVAAPGEAGGRIEVKPFFEICQDLIYRFEPGSQKYYSTITWKSEDHIDAIWQEFYRCDLNSSGAAVLQPVHDSLISQGFNAESYIRDEFDWIRSAIAHRERQEYLNLQRKGRSISLLPEQRSLLLKGLFAWEEKMRFVGVIDGLGLVAALQPYLGQISPEYRCILVDESQDFGTSELDIIRRLVKPAENDLFICGDAAQQVSSKYQRLKEAGIEIPGPRSRRIYKNYRNSREILSAAYAVLYNNVSEFHMDSDEFEVLEPEYANFSGSTPLLLYTDSLQAEIGHAITFIRDELNVNPNWKGCLAIAGYSLYQLQEFGLRIGIPVLDGSTSISDQNFYLSDLAQTKGFEFDIMCVANVSQGVIPDPEVPELEQAKDLAQLYVAMTRAKSQLILSFNGKPSPLLDGTDTEFLTDAWDNYQDSVIEDFGLPQLLSELHKDTLIPSRLIDMTGEEFLYTHSAVGLSINLIERIRRLIGKNRPGDSTRKWVDIGWAYQGTIQNPRDRQRFGPAAVKEFHQLAVKLRLDEALRERQGASSKVK